MGGFSFCFADLNSSLCFRHIGFNPGKQPWVGAIAAAHKRISCAVKQHAATAVIHISSIGPTLRLQRFNSAIGPVYVNLRKSPAIPAYPFGVGQSDFLCRGSRIFQKQSRATLNAGWITKFKSFVRCVQNVACHIAQGTGAKIPPAAEVPWSINFVIGTHLGRPDKQIPIKRIRNSLLLLRRILALQPDRPVCESFNFSYIPNHTALNPLRDQVNPFAGCSLVAHLRCHLVFICQLCQQS